jgi:hypothetical protein
MASYSYDFDDFTSLGSAELDPKLLQKRVDDDAGITTTCDGVTVDPVAETVVFSFVSTLGGSEVTALDALVAAFDGETLAEAKVRCAADCRGYLRKLLEDPGDGVTVEYPTSSGKLWSLTQRCRASWALLGAGSGGLTYPTTIRTCDGMESLTLTVEADMTAFVEAMADGFEGELDDCETAVANVAAAVDIAAAEAARDAYTGG